jgi:transposase-like protein
MLKVAERRDEREAGEEILLLDEIARHGARRMLIEALRAEADDYIERHRGERDEQGHALVVRNGRAQARKLTLGAGTVELNAPRVDDRRRDEHGHRQRFTSHILPPYMRRSPKVSEVLPILSLRGLLTGDFRPALEALLGADAAGWSPTNIARLTAGWEKAYTDFRQRNLGDGALGFWAAAREVWPETRAAEERTFLSRAIPAPAIHAFKYSSRLGWQGTSWRLPPFSCNRSHQRCDAGSSRRASW